MYGMRPKADNMSAAKENGTILAYRRTYFFKANKYGISRFHAKVLRAKLLREKLRAPLFLSVV